MKKIITLFTLVICAFGTFAQVTFPVNGVSGKQPANTKTSLEIQKKPQHQRASATDRWYCYGEAMDLFWTANGAPSALKGNNLFPDTTILVDYGTSGYSGPWIHTIGDLLDVKSDYFNDPTIYPGEMMLSSTSPFKVDSLGYYFIYDRSIPNPAIVDTLVFEVAISSALTGGYFLDPVAANLGTDTVFIKTINYNYSTNKLSTNSLNLSGKQTYKIPLDAATYADSSANGIHYVEFQTTGLATANAGSLVVSSVKFIPGYTWTANVDTLDSKNSVFFLSYEEQDNAYPIYTKRDYNSSYIVSQVVNYNNAGGWNGRYIPSFAYMGSTPGYSYEHHLVYYKISDPFVGINEVSANGITLGQNNPNPFNGTTTISYEIESSANVSLVVYDVTGKKVIEIGQGNKSAGKHAITINSEKLSSGVYYYTLSAGDNSMTKKMIILD